jgi:hypothetical protein
MALLHRHVRSCFKMIDLGFVVGGNRYVTAVEMRKCITSQDVRRGDVQLPGLGKKLLEIRAEVIRGRGFQVRLEPMAGPCKTSWKLMKRNT